MYIALDMFCGAGGVSEGLTRAGFYVIGVDLNEQKNYHFPFIKHDAMSLPFGIDYFDFVWASPPCQPFTSLKSVFDSSKYPDLIEPTRELLSRFGNLYCIENVIGCPIRQDVILCGTMFGLRTYRHRLFELNFHVEQPEHPPHLIRTNRRKINRRKHWDAGGFVTVTGDIGSYVGPEAMGINWMTGAELSQAVPPAYAEYIGRAAIKALNEK